MSKHVVVKGYSSVDYDFCVEEGDEVELDWANSSDYWVYATSTSGSSGYIPLENVRKKIVQQNYEIPGKFIYRDLVAETNKKDPKEDAKGNRQSIILPNLAALLNPMSVETFFSKVWKKHPMAIVGTSERLAEIRKDFLDFNVADLLNNSGDVVVWMKTTTGKMQHFYASAADAYRCYLAGHSLYFNPSEAVQKKWIRPLALELGWDFGIEKDNIGGIGGDIEIFACAGTHTTDWHFDGQENFTVQLRGTKRWYVRKSGLVSPTTNCNPSTDRLGAFVGQAKVHGNACPNFCQLADSLPLTPAELHDDKDCINFTLHPGSVMYLPAGCWHRVVSESEETGSLSINFSMYSSSYADLILDSMRDLLSRKEALRNNISRRGRTKEQLRQELTSLLQVAIGELQKVDGEDLLPDNVFLEERKSVIDLREWPNHLSLEARHKCTISPLCNILDASIVGRITEMVYNEDLEVAQYFVLFGLARDHSMAETSLLIPVALKPVMDLLCDWKDHNKTPFTIAELCKTLNKSQPTRDIETLFHALRYLGFLRVS
eukprot:TRINITY_DN7517_c0_g1_i1.p1 TRINITY_DN7517_c0_g1~~TRINITY_DN7517_c0_g1_i1.p1  ORF type:complete len:568 (+),score=81.74 TRINITY_DN7517_c0_g1_i1:71-1705(+)